MASNASYEASGSHGILLWLEVLINVTLFVQGTFGYLSERRRITCVGGSVMNVCKSLSRSWRQRVSYTPMPLLDPSQEGSIHGCRSHEATENRPRLPDVMLDCQSNACIRCSITLELGRFARCKRREQLAVFESLDKSLVSDHGAVGVIDDLSVVSFIAAHVHRLCPCWCAARQYLELRGLLTLRPQEETYVCRRPLSKVLDKIKQRLTPRTVFAYINFTILKGRFTGARSRAFWT